MKKLIAISLILPLLTGCGLIGQRKVTTEAVTVKVPVVFSPKPPVIIRPDLVIHDMTEAQRNNPGELAKYYRATIIQLIGYSEELEDALNEYLIISEELEENNKILGEPLEFDDN